MGILGHHEPEGSGELKNVNTYCHTTLDISNLHCNQRTNGPVNAHLISGPHISTKYTKPGKKQGKEMTLTFNTHFHLLN